jgi:hypothetical protein
MVSQGALADQRPVGPADRRRRFVLFAGLEPVANEAQFTGESLTVAVMLGFARITSL